MRSYRRFLFNFILLLCVFGSVVYTSCKNKCGSTTCQNGGTCSNNTCICPTGYSGNSCQTGWSDVAIGTYNCTRANCNPAVTGASTWVTAVTKNSTNSGYTINFANFDNSNTIIVGSIDSAIRDTARIKIIAAGGNGVNATGFCAPGIIKLTFTTYAGGISVGNCSMVMNKQ